MAKLKNLPSRQFATLWTEHVELVGQVKDGHDISEANERLWAIDDKIMSTPAQRIQDLAVKAKVVDTRWRLGSAVPEAYVRTLLADITTGATGGAQL